MSEPVNEAQMADTNLVVKKDPFLPAKEVQNGSGFRDLLFDILNKQDTSDFQATERDCINDSSNHNDANHVVDTLTLYVTNDEESTESFRTIQVETDKVERIYSTYFNNTKIEKIPSTFYQDNDEKQNQGKIKNCFPTVVTLKVSQDSTLFKASLVQVEEVRCLIELLWLHQPPALYLPR